MILLPNQNISEIYVGNKRVSAIYVGDILVWSSFIKEKIETDAIALTMTAEAFAILCNSLRDAGICSNVCIEIIVDASNASVELCKEDSSIVMNGSAKLSTDNADTISEVNHLIESGYSNVISKNNLAQRYFSDNTTIPIFTSSLKLIEDIPGQETNISILIFNSDANIIDGLTFPNIQNTAIIQRVNLTPVEGHTSPEADNMLSIFTDKTILGNAALSETKTVPIALANVSHKKVSIDFIKQNTIISNMYSSKVVVNNSFLSKSATTMEPIAIISGRPITNLSSHSTLNIVQSPITELAYRKLSVKKDFSIVNTIAIMPIVKHTQLNSILRKHLSINIAMPETCALNPSQSNNTQFSGYCLGTIYASITLRQESQATNFDSTKVISLDNMTISQIDNILIQS